VPPATHERQGGAGEKKSTHSLTQAHNADNSEEKKKSNMCYRKCAMKSRIQSKENGGINKEALSCTKKKKRRRADAGVGVARRGRGKEGDDDGDGGGGLASHARYNAIWFVLRSLFLHVHYPSPTLVFAAPD
jgi:hypothetical protein